MLVPRLSGAPRTAFVLATLSLLALAGSVTANAPDPLKSDVWGSDYTGT